MTISSRTPEGSPSRCPICGADVRLEFSPETGDAPCPVCGELLWKSSMIARALLARIGSTLNVSPDDIAGSTQIVELDLLDVVELVMEIEEEFDIHISDDDYKDIRTIGDLIRFLTHRSNRFPPPAD